jgi:2-polyprenyl-3-methyl-5-hydroxy-6-metoxy-1,4-benzoquinol methylase
MSKLTFTGERYLPECPREMLYEHYARYAMALHLVAGKKVLDCACGEGYGSAALASVAASVIGIDLSDTAIAHARAKYSRANLMFQSGNAAALDLESESFDVIVSFETLEHLSEQEQMLEGFARLLKPDGILLISSPDKANYSDATGYTNEFHVKELYRDEFQALLSQHFAAHRLYAQALNFQSMIWDLKKSSIEAVDFKYLSTTSGIQNGVVQAPMYYIAIAARSAQGLEAASDLFYFTDEAQSLYAHYNSEIRNGIALAHIVEDLRIEIAHLKSELSKRS